MICLRHKPQPELKIDWQSLADVAIQLRDGRTGKVLREAAPKAITERRRRDPVGANWVHQRLLIANCRGTPQPRHIVVKLGDTYVALAVTETLVQIMKVSFRGREQAGQMLLGNPCESDCSA